MTQLPVGRRRTLGWSSGPTVPAGSSSKEVASKAKRVPLRVLCTGCILTPLGRSSCSSSVLANRMPEMGSGDALRSSSSCSSSPSRTSTWKCLSSSLSTECWIFQLFFRGLVRSVQTVQRWEVPRVQFFWRLLKRPLTSQRQVRPDRFALAWLDSGYMFCDSALAVWQNFAFST